MRGDIGPADVDLPPDELLTHLDDLVVRLTDDGQDTIAEEVMDTGADQAATGGVGATCLYAVYDPVSRHCAPASAGHPLPVLVSPDGGADPAGEHARPPPGRPSGASRGCSQAVTPGPAS
ncbi:SpoIIE family protein phosphatase [Streptomyces sp. NBRC 110028]|uniref:SpoIIE family protein phosphatase n=1 Tax=Streptomyces sp. NBRC 110028 TaxID=1621260 RepID=UPI00351C1B81